MPRIGNIDIVADVDARGVNEQLRRTERQVEALERRTESAARANAAFQSSLGGVGQALRQVGTATVAAGAAAIGFGILARNSAQLGQELLALSGQIGISVESFQRFRQVYQFTGGEFDEAIETARDFAEAISLAAEGTGTQAEAFRRLGFSAQQARRFIGQDLLQVLQQIQQPFQELLPADQLTFLRDIGIQRVEGIQNLLADTELFNEALRETADIGVISQRVAEDLTDLSREVQASEEALRVQFATALSNASESLVGLGQAFRTILPSAMEQAGAAVSAFAGDFRGVLGTLGILAGGRIGTAAIGAGITGAAALRSNLDLFAFRQGVRQAPEGSRRSTRTGCFSKSRCCYPNEPGEAERSSPGGSHCNSDSRSDNGKPGYRCRRSNPGDLRPDRSHRFRRAPAA